MSKCTVHILDEVNCKLIGLEIATRRKLENKLKFFQPSAKHTPAYKLGRWDGCSRFCTIGGTTYLTLLDQLLPIIMEDGYDIEIKDDRIPHQFNFPVVTEDYHAGKVWPESHDRAGQPIMLRDYQVEVINDFMNNLQGLGALSTGMGKCLAGDVKLDLDVDGIVVHGMTFSKLAEFIEYHYETTLVHDVELDISELEIRIGSPSGYVKISHFIKKENLEILEVCLENDYKFKCATTHIVRKNGVDVHANELKAGDCIDHMNGPEKVKTITKSENEDCYDICVPYPHVYYDSNGVVHHNTLLTATMSKIVEEYGRSLVIVPNKDLVKQTFSDYENLGLDVGVYFGDKKEVGKTHTICTWQSLNSLDKRFKDGESDMSLQEFCDGMIAVIVDEVHGASATALQGMLSGPLANVPIRWGLTGTIPKEDFKRVGIQSVLGNVITKVSASDLQDSGVLSSCHINVIQLQDDVTYRTYQEELSFLTTNQRRIDHIAKFVNTIAESGNTLVLVDRLKAGEMLIEQIPDSVFVSGKMKTNDRKDQYDEVTALSNKVIVATFAVAATGINIVNLHNIIMLEPGKSYVRTIQSIGRGLRKGSDKDHVEIYDLTSNCKFSKKHLSERKAFYKEANYPFTVTKVKYK